MIVDIFVLIVVLGSIIISFFRGFIREVLTIISIVGGMMASYMLGPLLIPSMEGWLGIVEGEEAQNLFGVVPYPLLANILSYVSVLVIFVLILSVISHYISKFVSEIGLGALDRTLGIVFGFVRAVLLLGLMYLPFFYLAGEEQKEEWFQDSKTQIYLETTSSWIDGYMPKDMEDNMEEGSDIIKDVSKTRQKLEEMNLLKSKLDGLENGNNSSNGKDGYATDFREKMDKLIEDNTDNSSNLNE